jgi:hypothetical protein
VESRGGVACDGIWVVELHVCLCFGLGSSGS